jgi:S-DNA-T family DNA segregation ATPase FtsK/SpoIIIE
MNSFPHCLIGGDTGTGKSRILLLILTNLIKYCSNLELYLLQIRKNDLGVFQNCAQVKVNSKTLEEVLEALESIDKECRRREKLIDNTKGYYNISDYNEVNGDKLKYIYVVVEEFSFLNISRGDSKEEKVLKSKCLKHLKMIVNVGRSSGVFLITALQKPTSDSIPSDIKAQLCTRISLKIADGPACKVILGNENATKLGDREIICRTLDEQKGYSYTMDHTMVMENIKNRIVEKKQIEKPKEVIENDLSNILEILNGING